MALRLTLRSLMLASVLTHSDNSRYAVRLRSPKPFATLRASHTRIPLSENALYTKDNIFCEEG